MVPLTTIQGFTKEHILELVSGRDVYLWGGGPMGRDVLTSLVACGVKPKASLDTNPHARHFCGLPVQHPDTVIACHKDAGKHLVVIASESYRKIADERCRQEGLVRGRDFIDYFSVPRPAAVVDVAGQCGPACSRPPGQDPRSAPDRRNMSVETYRQVLFKLLRDLPLLTSIELSSWRDPLLNPHIADIIRATVPKVPCVVVTSLSETCSLEAILQAGPTEFRVVVNGFEMYHREPMASPAWSELLRNLRTLSGLHYGMRSHTVVSIRASALRNDTMAGKNELIALCQELKLKLVFTPPHPTPYDALLNQLESQPISEYNSDVIARMPWDIDRILKLCRRDRGRPCLPQRIFPIVNRDLSVSLCHVYTGPILHPNYLQADWIELLQKRHAARQCETCQKHGLHRLDLDVLDRRYPQMTI